MHQEGLHLLTSPLERQSESLEEMADGLMLIVLSRFFDKKFEAREVITWWINNAISLAGREPPIFPFSARGQGGNWIRESRWGSCKCRNTPQVVREKYDSGDARS